MSLRGEKKRKLISFGKINKLVGRIDLALSLKSVYHPKGKTLQTAENSYNDIVRIKVEKSPYLKGKKS